MTLHGLQPSSQSQRQASPSRRCSCPDEAQPQRASNTSLTSEARRQWGCDRLATLQTLLRKVDLCRRAGFSNKLTVSIAVVKCIRYGHLGCDACRDLAFGEKEGNDEGKQPYGPCSEKATWKMLECQTPLCPSDHGAAPARWAFWLVRVSAFGPTFPLHSSFDHCPGSTPALCGYQLRLSC